jgi:hypothetical protein
MAGCLTLGNITNPDWLNAPQLGSYSLFMSQGELYSIDYYGNIKAVGDTNKQAILSAITNSQTIIQTDIFNSEVTVLNAISQSEADINANIDRFNFLIFSGNTQLNDIYCLMQTMTHLIQTAATEVVICTPATGFPVSLAGYQQYVYLYTGATIPVIDQTKNSDIQFGYEFIPITENERWGREKNSLKVNDGITADWNNYEQKITWDTFYQMKNHAMNVPHLLFFSCSTQITSINAQVGMQKCGSCWTKYPGTNRKGLLGTSYISEIRIPLSYTGINSVILTDQQLSFYSIENVLVTLDYNGQLRGNVDLSGGQNAPATTPNSIVAKNNLIRKGWNVITN